MAPRTARILPIRRKDFKVAEFLAFVAANGGEVGTPTNPYEVVRYRAYWRGTQTSAVHIVYAKENGLLTWTGGSQGHYRAFLDGAPMELLPGVDAERFSNPNKRPGHAPKGSREKLPPSKGQARRDALLERDGGDCWFCGMAMGDDITVEHLIAKANGGRNTLANYALAHRKCNADAADLPLVEKIAMRDRLRAQGMSTGTAKTPKAVEGRSPASPVAEGDAPHRGGSTMIPIQGERK